MPITRKQLIEGLDRANPADQACREALEAGAGFRVEDGRVRLVELIPTYDRRVGHLSSKGVATIGADTLVGRLSALDDECVRLGLVHSDDFNFTLFLDCDLAVVLASVGVAASAANPDWDWSNLNRE